MLGTYLIKKCISSVADTRGYISASPLKMFSKLEQDTAWVQLQAHWEINSRITMSSFFKKSIHKKKTESG